MSFNPESFRGMTPDQMLTALVVDEALTKHTEARALGKACVLCLDTGLASGKFCSCSNGAKLSYQANHKNQTL